MIRQVAEEQQTSARRMEPEQVCHGPFGEISPDIRQDQGVNLSPIQRFKTGFIDSETGLPHGGHNPANILSREFRNREESSTLKDS